MHLLELPRVDDTKPAHWKVCIKEPFRNCSRIYPIQQRFVKAVLDQLQENPNVMKIWVFGSSVSWSCHVGSDVDIYVELEQDEILQIEHDDFALDLWTNFMVDNRLLAEIKKKGIVVYVRDSFDESCS